MLETDLRFAGYSEPDARRVLTTARPDRRNSRRPIRCAVARPADGSNGVGIVVDSGDGQKGSTLEAATIAAAPGFFDTLRIPLLHGRVFDNATAQARRASR